MTRHSAGHLTAATGAIAVLLSACGGSEPGLARGKLIYDACAPCHGEDGAGREELAAPAIAGASDWYLKAQLLKFQDGARGYHHTDLEGLRMRPMSRALFADRGDIESVVEYIVSLPIPDPPPTIEGGDLEAGEAEYLALCANCHGRDGRGVETGVRELDAPSLLHLNDWYLESSIAKYRDGARGVGDAAGATMRAPVTDFTADRIRNVTTYVMSLQRLPRKVAAPPPPPLDAVDVDPAILPEGVTLAMAQEGQEIFNGAKGICFTCHLREGTGGPLAPSLTDAEWLNIDGEYESIVEVVVAGVPQPTQYPGVMQPRAGRPLTDEQVRAVAAYVYTLSR